MNKRRCKLVQLYLTTNYIANYDYIYIFNIILNMSITINTQYFQETMCLYY